jgi:asparagine synthase (glutamine-hydrolysing)
MCGITGEFDFSGAADPAAIRRMTAALSHRGPDDSGIHCEGAVALGQRRLSIIDLSPTGHQPMWTPDGKAAIVFNGEIYNHASIRPDLEARGWRFRGTSDTEVLLYAVREWGVAAALQRCIGMFAFAIWDGPNRRLTVARDRLGVKPLFYQLDRQRFIFGSELRALYAHPGFHRELSTAGLGQYLSYGYTLRDRTVFEHARKLPAGHFATISESGEWNLTCYWDPSRVRRGAFAGTFEEAAAEMERLAESAFRYRLVSDVPVGVFLSGGIDSTFLAAFLKRRVGADLQHITIGFENAAYDEAPRATEIARHLGLRHTVRYVGAQEALDGLMRFCDIWDEPFGDTSGVPTSILCGLAREEVKVALSADGGDELFCGYDSYALYERRYRMIAGWPPRARAVAAAALRRLPYSAVFGAVAGRWSAGWNPQLLARFEKSLEILATGDVSALLRVMNEKGWPARDLGALLGRELPTDRLLAGTPFAPAPGNERGPALIDRMMRTDLSAFLGDDILTKVDRASMSVGLECREPFLDHRLVEFAFSLPLDFHFADGVHKRLLKHVLARWVEPGVLNAPKRGFSIPLYHWMRGPWKPMVMDYLSPARVVRVGILDPQRVAKEVERFYRYPGGRAEKIMLMMNLHLWAERWR